MGGANQNSVGDLQVVTLAVSLNLVVCVHIVRLAVNFSSEVFGKSSTLALFFDYVEKILKHEELLLGHLELFFISAGHLKERLFVNRVVVRKVLIEPNFSYALSIEADHPAGDLEGADFVEAVIEASDRFAEDV